MGKIVLIGAMVVMAGLMSCQDQTAGNAETEAVSDSPTAAVTPTDTSTAIGNADTSASQPSIVSDAPLTNFTGVYTGVLPCADCEGIETQLTLNENKTYSISRKYLGKEDDRPFVSNGRWEWMSNNAMKLNDPSGPPTLIYVMEGKVLMLDRSGNRVTGNLADKYYLFKAK
jgi:uncharacterized lipoprotein NlpE involved in copper resistance